jgi:hypothetical protein
MSFGNAMPKAEKTKKRRVAAAAAATTTAVEPEIPEALRRAIQGKQQAQRECKVHEPLLKDNKDEQTNLPDYCNVCDEKLWWISEGVFVTYLEKIRMDEKDNIAARLKHIGIAFRGAAIHLSPKIIEAVKKRTNGKRASKDVEAASADTHAAAETKFLEALDEGLHTQGFYHKSEIDESTLDEMARKLGLKLVDGSDDNDNDDVACTDDDGA